MGSGPTCRDSCGPILEVTARRQAGKAQDHELLETPTQGVSRGQETPRSVVNPPQLHSLTHFSSCKEEGSRKKAGGKLPNSSTRGASLPWSHRGLCQALCLGHRFCWTWASVKHQSPKMFAISRGTSKRLSCSRQLCFFFMAQGSAVTLGGKQLLPWAKQHSSVAKLKFLQFQKSCSA